MLILAIAAGLGVALGLSVPGAGMAVALSVGFSGAVQYVLIASAQLLLQRPGNQGLVAVIEDIAGADASALLPTATVAAAAALIAGGLARGRRARKARVGISETRSATPGRSKALRRAGLAPRPIHAAAERRIERLLNQ